MPEMAAPGTKRRFVATRQFGRFWSKADITRRNFLITQMDRSRPAYHAQCVRLAAGSLRLFAKGLGFLRIQQKRIHTERNVLTKLHARVKICRLFIVYVCRIRVPV